MPPIIKGKAAKKIVATVAHLIDYQKDTLCHHALAHAVMTAPESIPLAARERLGLFLNKYWETK